MFWWKEVLVNVSWSEVTEGNPVGYKIYVNPVGTTPTKPLMAFLKGPTKATLLLTIQRGKAYEVSVSSYDLAGNDSKDRTVVQMVYAT